MPWPPALASYSTAKSRICSRIRPSWSFAKHADIENHAWFPNRTNAEFAYVKSRREIDLVVWERGCGITLACGTGACATAVAAILTGRADEATPIRLNLPGGTMEITVAAGLTGVAMKGPAHHVFDSEVDLTRLQPRPR